jgi:hypothetical protein
MKCILAVVVGLVAAVSADVSWAQSSNWGPAPPAGWKFPGYGGPNRVNRAPAMATAPVATRTFSAEPAAPAVAAPAPAAQAPAAAPAPQTVQQPRTVRTYSAEPGAPVYRPARRPRLNPYAMPNTDHRKFSL